MGKCANDSDSEKRRNKRSHQSNSRRRSSSSESSSSRSRYKKTKKSSKRRRSRSRSTDRHHQRSRRSRSKSGSNHKVHKSKQSHYRSRRSSSKDRHRSRRSRSKDYIKEFVSKKPRSSSSSSTYSSNSSSSSDVKNKFKNLKNPDNGVEVRLSNESQQDFDIPPMDSETLEEINADSFDQKSFSSKSKKLQNTIVIDLKKQTIKVPQVEPVEPDSIFHNNLFLSEEARSEKWVKELYIYRQKALQQGIKNNPQ